MHAHPHTWANPFALEFAGINVTFVASMLPNGGIWGDCVNRWRTTCATDGLVRWAGADAAQYQRYCHARWGSARKRAEAQVRGAVCSILDDERVIASTAASLR